MPRFRTSFSSLVLALCAATALLLFSMCDSVGETHGRARAPTPNDRLLPNPEGARHDQFPPTPAAAVTDHVTDTGFELRGTAPGPFHPGAAGTFGISLTARSNYHVNQEYPIRVTLHAPVGVALAKPELARADAAHFDERAAEFAVGVTPSAAGTQRVTADVDFAVCTPENCMPDSRTIAVSLAVQ